MATGMKGEFANVNTCVSILVTLSLAAMQLWFQIKNEDLKA